LDLRRTPLVAGGFIAGALVGALPPMQMAYASWQCAANGGRYEVALRVCGDRRAPPALPGSDLRGTPLERMDEGSR
jgi:hypothetical protein